MKVSIPYSIFKVHRRKLLSNQSVIFSAKTPEKSCPQGVRAGFSNNQQPFLIHTLLCANMLNTALPVRPQKVEAQTVLLGLDFINQLLPQSRPLRRIDNTLKNGVLHPLAVVLARLGHPVQTARAARINCRNIVADEHKHNEISSLPDKRRIAVQIPPEIPRQPECLDMKKH